MGHQFLSPLLGVGHSIFSYPWGWVILFYNRKRHKLKKEMIEFNNRTMILPEQLATHLKRSAIHFRT